MMCAREKVNVVWVVESRESMLSLGAVEDLGDRLKRELKMLS